MKWLFLLAFLAIGACYNELDKDWYPAGAYDIQPLSEGWAYFKLDGNRYILCMSNYGSSIALAPKVEER